MPLYEFNCQTCEKNFEMLVASARWKGAKCPHCGSTKLTKSFSTFASKVVAGHGSAPPPMPACGRPGGCGCTGGRHRH